MKKEYDLSKLKSRRNPYARFLKKQITIRINNSAINYFKTMADDTGIPYQNLIDSYLTDCAQVKRKLVAQWR
jgi:predicted DNA binding CopG/RHH family protein